MTLDLDHFLYFLHGIRPLLFKSVNRSSLSVCCHIICIFALHPVPVEYSTFVPPIVDLVMNVQLHIRPTDSWRSSNSILTEKLVNIVRE